MERLLLFPREGGAAGPKQLTSNRAMFLPSYSLPFSVSVLLMKGLLSLGLPSPEGRRGVGSDTSHGVTHVHPVYSSKATLTL